MQEGTSPIGGRMLFPDQGDGPAATWLNDAMRAISYASADFQATFRRLMESKMATRPGFREFMGHRWMRKQELPRPRDGTDDNL